MHAPLAIQDLYLRAIRLWLIAIAALIALTLIVGGATRLTESGLSIVEWKPVTGVLPPLSDAAWQAEFDKYKLIPQYQQLNRGMGLEDFKTIYWWEWAHRLIARTVGAAYLLPFLFFLWRGWVGPPLRAALWTIFGLGAFQGAVGWWMVASGLSERVIVSQYRLAFHMTLACVIYAAVVWTLQRLRPAAEPVAERLRWSALALVVLVLVQIYLGALVAGLRGGNIYNTWPLIDGAVIPDATRLFFEQPLWRNFFENVLTVQLEHRLFADALWLATVLHAVDAARLRQGRAGALILAATATLQMVLGIVTLLLQSPLRLALAHQAAAIVLLTIAVMHAERLIPRREAGRAASLTPLR